MSTSVAEQSKVSPGTRALAGLARAFSRTTTAETPRPLST